MYKYDARLIHQSHDEDGILEIVERNGVRSLHFGTISRQSSMSLADPERLVLAYVRAMTAWLLFKEFFENALVVGLGGGSLAKFLLHHFPEGRLYAVEYRKSVVKIARSHFGLPLDTRLKIVIDDGGHFIRQRTETLREKFSLIFLDAFDQEGMAHSMRNIAFFDACKSLLKPDGILILNLWTTDKPLYDSCADWLDSTFKSKVLFLTVPDRGNSIGFAFNEGNPVFSLNRLRSRALALEQRYRIEFPIFLKDICRQNAETLNHVIKK
jgi:spermidine synthase